MSKIIARIKANTPEWSRFHSFLDTAAEQRSQLLFWGLSMIAVAVWSLLPWWAVILLILGLVLILIAIYQIITKPRLDVFQVRIDMLRAAGERFMNGETGDKECWLLTVQDLMRRHDPTSVARFCALVDEFQGLVEAEMHCAEPEPWERCGNDIIKEVVNILKNFSVSQSRYQQNIQMTNETE